MKQFFCQSYLPMYSTFLFWFNQWKKIDYTFLLSMIFEMHLIILLSAAWLQIIFKNKRVYLIFLVLFSFLIMQ